MGAELFLLFPGRAACLCRVPGVVFGECSPRGGRRAGRTARDDRFLGVPTRRQTGIAADITQADSRDTAEPGILPPRCSEGPIRGMTPRCHLFRRGRPGRIGEVVGANLLRAGRQSQREDNPLSNSDATCGQPVGDHTEWAGVTSPSPSRDRPVTHRASLAVLARESRLCLSPLVLSGVHAHSSLGGRRGASMHTTPASSAAVAGSVKDSLSRPRSSFPGCVCPKLPAQGAPST
jgi:hypothetical protein